MMTTALRPQVLALYRRLIRLGRTWEAKVPQETPTERAFILDETRRLFRANSGVRSEAQVAEHIREAEARLAMAEHYRNPYPRPVNVPPRSYARKEGKKAGRAMEKLSDLSKPIYVKSIDDAAKKK